MSDEPTYGFEGSYGRATEQHTARTWAGACLTRRVPADRLAVAWSLLAIADALNRLADAVLDE